MPTAMDRKTNCQQRPPHFSAAERKSLRRRLLAWYKAHARDLPWRRTRDPYCIWLSEVMLQQTQVATVRGYFERFIAALPNVQRLAAADEGQVLRLWEGLGYYRRARQLHAAAKEIVSRHGGAFPRDPRLLQQLPGIGRYTAGAVASIAFDARAPILEANTIRLLSRLIGYRFDPRGSGGQQILWQVAEEILPHKRVAEFNQALMELGSLVCTPGEPACGKCPLSGLCAARAAGVQHEIPLIPARHSISRVREAAIIVRRNGRVLMRQCPHGERWAGLWDFPRFAVEADGPLFAREEIMQKVFRQTGVSCSLGTLQKTLKHGVTRFRITLDCYQAAYVCGRTRSSGGSPVRWIPLAELPDLPLSATGRKIARLVSFTSPAAAKTS